MPKATRRSVSSSGRFGNGIGQGSTSSDQRILTNHPYAGRDCVVVHAHDVLNGRGVNMAHHPGNERFRALIQSRSDPSYCSSYTLNEKKALSEEIVHHIEALDPPGRFLKRSGKTKNKRGLQGPWEVMSREEAIKKARQALRDCNRPDRDGYAKSVAAPEDVVESSVKRRNTGLTQQQYVKQLVATNAPSHSTVKTLSGTTTPNADGSEIDSKRNPSTSPALSKRRTDNASDNTADPTISWIPRKLVDGGDEAELYESHDTSPTTPNVRNTTPTTAATSGGLFSDGAGDFADASLHSHHHGVMDVAGAPSLHSPNHPSEFAHCFTASSPVPVAFEEALVASFHEDDIKPSAVSSFHDSTTDPLQEEVDGAALRNAFDGEEDFVAAFGRDDLM